MVVLFIMVGALAGAFAASLALWAGSSILFALLCYSVIGSLCALAVVFAVYLRNEAGDNSADWPNTREAKQPVSA